MEVLVVQLRKIAQVAYALDAQDFLLAVVVEEAQLALEAEILE
jgi:hypothetical protein